MKSIIWLSSRLIGVVMALLVFCGGPATEQASAALTMTVVPAVSPNPFNQVQSVTARAYASNVFASLAVNGGNVGGSQNTNPAYYRPLTSGSRISPTDVILTSDFPSWRGNINPTGAFANERGNVIRFGLCLSNGGGNNPQFYAGDILTEIIWSYAAHPQSRYFWLSGDNNFNYDDGFIGVDFGPNRVYGGGDDIIRDHNEYMRTTPIDMFLWLGNGAFVDASSQPGATPSERMNAAIEEIMSTADGEDFPIYCTYSFYDPTHTNVLASGISYVTVPVPGTISLVLMSLLSIARRRK